MDRSSRIFVAGHTGMVGSAIVRLLVERGYRNLLLVKRSDLDLRGGKSVLAYFRETQPEYVFMAAAKVGGIQANIAQPAEFMFDNLTMQVSVIHAAHQVKVKKLLFLGSSCMYPRDCPQPMKEECLLTGLPEPTNRAYAIAKIAGMEMCRAYAQQYGDCFFTAIPCNLYGPGDHYEPERAHVIPSLIRRFVEAKTSGTTLVSVWGSGNARREFMHVDDAAAGCLYLMNTYKGYAPVNVGTGHDITINLLAEHVRRCVGYDGRVDFDSKQPEGALRKALDVMWLTAFGWKAKIWLEEGLRRTVKEYMELRHPIKVERANALCRLARARS